MTTPRTCPGCNADLTDDHAIRTDELVPGTCFGSVSEDGSLDFDGETRISWDGQETEAVYCDACDRRLDTPRGGRPEDTLAAGWVTGALLSREEVTLLGDTDGNVNPVDLRFDVEGIGRIRVRVEAVLEGDA